RNRETVSAPPSIRMRWKPRAASAAMMAVGASWPFVAATGTISTPPGNRARAPTAVTTSLRAPTAASTRAVNGRRAGGFPETAADARGLRALDGPDGKWRFVGDRRASANHHRVHKRPQRVQMGGARLAVDVVRVSGERGDAGVDRLAALAN